MSPYQKKAVASKGSLRRFVLLRVHVSFSHFSPLSVRGEAEFCIHAATDLLFLLLFTFFLSSQHHLPPSLLDKKTLFFSLCRGAAEFGAALQPYMVKCRPLCPEVPKKGGRGGEEMMEEIPKGGGDGQRFCITPDETPRPHNKKHICGAS